LHSLYGQGLHGASGQGLVGSVTLTAVHGLRVGHAEVAGGGSGCTVILGPFRGAVEVLGTATGSRELGVLSPLHLVERVNAILLTGGSAFGLAAADGVLGWLEEQGEGFDTGLAKVPLVPAAVIFDLAPGVGRPGPGDGRRACADAGSGPVFEGRVGAGAGATVGKMRGMGSAVPGGVGSASRKVRAGSSGLCTVGALAVVNALGEIMGEDGGVLAGAGGETVSGAFPLGTSTTLSVVATDLSLSRVELGRLARMASTALPRCISPVHTPFDGDMVFAISTGKGGEPVPGEVLMEVGIAARELLEESVRRGVSVARRGAPLHTAMDP
jgi:L-aminopeptidase/D-esterase-like protein